MLTLIHIGWIQSLAPFTVNCEPILRAHQLRHIPIIFISNLLIDGTSKIGIPFKSIPELDFRTKETLHSVFVNGLRCLLSPWQKHTPAVRVAT